MAILAGLDGPQVAYHAGYDLCALLDNTSGLKPWGSPADEATELVLCDPAILDLTTFWDLRPFAGVCVRFAGFCARFAAFLGRMFAQKLQMVRPKANNCFQFLSLCWLHLLTARNSGFATKLGGA